MELPAKKEYAAFADDAVIADYAKDAVVAFFEAGIILGKEYNMYDPTGIATRAEFAAMIHRLLDS